MCWFRPQQSSYPYFCHDAMIITKKIAEYYLRYPIAFIILLSAVVAWIASGLLLAIVLVTALTVILYAGIRPLVNVIELLQEYFLSLLAKL